MDMKPPGRSDVSSCGPQSLTWSRVLQHKVLIVKLAAVDGLAAGAVVVGEVASLTHELRNDTVEAGAFEAEALLVRAQAAEVLCERYRRTFTSSEHFGIVIYEARLTSNAPQ